MHGNEMSLQALIDIASPYWPMPLQAAYQEAKAQICLLAAGSTARSRIRVPQSSKYLDILKP
jgi:hypothetical protein